MFIISFGLVEMQRCQKKLQQFSSMNTGKLLKRRLLPHKLKEDCYKLKFDKLLQINIPNLKGSTFILLDVLVTNSTANCYYPHYKGKSNKAPEYFLPKTGNTSTLQQTTFK